VLELAELTDGKEQYRAYRRDSVGRQMPPTLDGVGKRFLFFMVKEGNQGINSFCICQAQRRRLDRWCWAFAGAIAIAAFFGPPTPW